VIGLGTNAYSANTPEQMAPLREVLERMPQIGGKLVDTARVYGRSEAVIGELVESIGNRKQLFIATKTPMFGDFSDPQAVIDVSFKALRTDVIDLMQIHMMAGLTPLMPVFEKVKAAGRIRYIGISTSEDNQYDALTAAMRTYPLDFIQVDYSLANRNAAERVRGLAQERRMAVLINVPFGGRGRGPLPCSRRSGAVTVAIPGTTQRRNLEDNQGAGRGRLPDAAMRRRIEQHWDALV